MPAQIALRALADPAAVDIEAELRAALHEHDRGIDDRDQDDPAEGAMLHEVVDGAALQFERHDLEQKADDGEHDEQQLMLPARLEDVAEYASRQRAESGFLVPGTCGAHHREPRLLSCAPR